MSFEISDLTIVFALQVVFVPKILTWEILRAVLYRLRKKKKKKVDKNYRDSWPGPTVSSHDTAKKLYIFDLNEKLNVWTPHKIAENQFSWSYFHLQKPLEM